MHSLECEMHQWKDVDIFCRKKETGGYTSVHSWCIFGIIMMDVAPKKCCIFVLFTVHPPKRSLIWRKCSICSVLILNWSDNWLISLHINVTLSDIHQWKCTVCINVTQRWEGDISEPQGRTLWLFHSLYICFYMLKNNLSRTPNMSLEEHLFFPPLICVFFDSFVKFIDLNYGAFLYGFNITIMLFFPHV